ncbi:MAG: BatA domain-containing protein [Candidatus Latescibacterota bacterium]|nr:BatA domain-containing protein [Candidatus Latescibacterota bacterium]
MQFLNPAFLFGLIATLIPIALHLLRRERAKSVSFSDLRFLSELQKSRTKRILFRQWLILILRTLSVGLIILAFARPTYQSGQHWGGQPIPTAVAILVDLSFYTKYRDSTNTLFDQQLEKLNILLSSLDKRDEVVIIPIAAKPGEILSGELKNIIQQCNKLTPTQERANIHAALLQAISHLNTFPQLTHKIFLLTTASGYNWPEIDIKNETLTHSKIFLIKSTTKSFSNTTISQLYFSPWMASTSASSNLTAKVGYVGNSPKNSYPIHLFIENERVNRRSIDLHSGMESTVQIPFIPKQSGWVSGYVESDPDNLSIDNKRYFTFKIPEKTSVTLIESTQQATYYYLREALSAITDFDPTLSLSIISKYDLVPNLLDSTDVLILSDLKNITSNKVASTIYQFVENGGGLLIFPDGAKNLKHNHQHFLRSLNPLRLGEIRGKPSPRNSPYYLDPKNQFHPVFAGLFPRFPSDKVHFYAYYELVKQPGMQSLIHFNSGDIAIASGKRGKGLTILFAFPLDLDWTNWPLSGSFSSSIQRLIRKFAFQTELTNNYLVGDQPIHNGHGHDFYEQLEVLSPTGASILVNTEQGPDGYYWNMPLLNEAGIWRLKSQNDLIGQFAVNIDARRYPPNSSLIGTSRITILNNEEDLATQIRSQRYGQELWQICTAIALLLLLIELWVGQTPHDKNITRL